MIGKSVNFHTVDTNQGLINLDPEYKFNVLNYALCQGRAFNQTRRTSCFPFCSPCVRLHFYPLISSSDGQNRAATHGKEATFDYSIPPPVTSRFLYQQYGKKVDLIFFCENLLAKDNGKADSRCGKLLGFIYVLRTNWLQCTEGHVLKSDGRRTDGGHDTNASITMFFVSDYQCCQLQLLSLKIHRNGLFQKIYFAIKLKIHSW